MAVPVRVFRLGGGRGWSVVTQRRGQVIVVGVYATREQALEAAHRIKGGRVAVF